MQPRRATDNVVVSLPVLRTPALRGSTVSGGVLVPRPHAPELRRRAVELARERAKPVSQIACDLGMSDSCLRNWMDKADINDGRRESRTPMSVPSWWNFAASCGRRRWRTRSPPGGRLLRSGERPPVYLVRVAESSAMSAAGPPRPGPAKQIRERLTAGGR